MLKLFFGGVLGLLLLTGGAAAQSCSSYPYALTNGTTADAGQVMADFNCAALKTGATLTSTTLTSATLAGSTSLPGSGIIASSGVVGIGTTSPSSMLFVEGEGSNYASGSTFYAYDPNPSYGGNATLAGIASASTATTSYYLLGLYGNGTNVFHVRGDGLAYVAGGLGIRTTTPAQALEVNGQIQVDSLASGSATNLCINGNVISSCSSSIRYKENIKSAPFGLTEIEQMRPVTFKWKGRDEKDFGFVAEDMAKINPLFVTYKNGKIEGVKYPQLTAVLVKAIQEQQFAIQTLIAENKGEAKRVQSLKMQITALEHKIGIQTAQR